jgi:hypothetical protein
LGTPSPSGAVSSPCGSGEEGSGSGSSSDTTTSEGSVDSSGSEDLPLQVPVLPEGGGSCARLSTAAIPFVAALLSLLTSAVTAGDAVREGCWHACVCGCVWLRCCEVLVVRWWVCALVCACVGRLLVGW